tara:strand:- start:973 stop:1263 length:291 start_codon:yes stop_codon:yes gene_type:complete
MKSCDWCSFGFTPKVSYQIYCTPACRELATRKKIYDRYKKIKIRDRSTKDRLCSGGCGTVLSVYNDNTFCNVCMVNKNKVEKMIEDLKGLFDYEQE